MTRAAARAGLTLLEVLLVTMGLTALAGLALPRIGRALLEARASDAVDDLEVVQAAALRYRGVRGEWPPEVDLGRVPPDLDAFLPDDFSFDRDVWVLDWENWSGRPGGFVGVTVVLDGEELARAVRNLLGGTGTWSDGRNRVARVVAWQ